MISFHAMLDLWKPSIQLNDAHRATLRRVGVIAAAVFVALNVGVAIVALIAAVLR